MTVDSISGVFAIVSTVAGAAWYLGAKIEELKGDLRLHGALHSQLETRVANHENRLNRLEGLGEDHASQ